jgi:hypothetical protein
VSEPFRKCGPDCVDIRVSDLRIVDHDGEVALEVGVDPFRDFIKQMVRLVS